MLIIYLPDLRWPATAESSWEELMTFLRYEVESEVYVSELSAPGERLEEVPANKTNY